MSTGLDRHTAEASRNMDAVLSGIIGTSPQQLASHLSGGGASAEAGENASAAVHPFASLVAGLDLIKGAICGGSFDQNTLVAALPLPARQFNVPVHWFLAANPI